MEVGRATPVTSPRRWRREGRRLELQLGDQEISRKHLLIKRREAGWELSDYSKNGTVVNGMKMPRATPPQVPRAILCDGDVIEVGRRAPHVPRRGPRPPRRRRPRHDRDRDAADRVPHRLARHGGPRRRPDADRALDGARADPRRDRHRQGADRAGDPRPVAAPRRVRAGELRRAAAHARRERAVRVQARRVLGRQGRPRGTRPPSGRRDLVPRRDRRAPRGVAGRAAARAPGGRGPPDRRDRHHPHRRARRRRHAPEPRDAHRRGPLPPGPVRAARRLRHRAAAPADPAPRTSAR